MTSKRESHFWNFPPCPLLDNTSTRIPDEADVSQVTTPLRRSPRKKKNNSHVDGAYNNNTSFYDDFTNLLLTSRSPARNDDNSRNPQTNVREVETPSNDFEQQSPESLGKILSSY